MPTREEVLQTLRRLETTLADPALENRVLQQDEETRRKFVAARQNVTILKGKLENAQLAEIAERLDRLGPELSAGIDQLEAALSRVESAVAVVNTISSVLGIVARIAAFP